jgi:LmbE family N-acetylglucosaminyl deacetylase
MERLQILSGGSGPRRVLAVGAHCDDIEIGCGGTFLRLAAERAELEVLWVTLCSTPERAAEARGSVVAFQEGFARARLLIHEFRDGFLPYTGMAVKEAFEAVKRQFDPDLIFTHAREDRHQDHRLVSELTWNTWRNHLIFEYEIPKYDGDLGIPNAFFHLPASVLERKIELVVKHYPTQAGKHWFTPELLRALPRIRGMESVAPEGLAEAFTCRKLAF